MSSALVVGGGISGLAAAEALIDADPTRSVTVLEAADVVGGKLRGHEVAGRWVDVGAEAVLARRPEAVDLMQRTGLTDLIVHPTDAAAQVWSRGTLHALPRRTLMGVPADPQLVGGLLTDDEVARVAAERPEPLEADDISIGDLVTSRMGPAVTQRLVEPLLGGVYAGHATLISARAALPALLSAAQQGQRLQDTAAQILPAPDDGTQTRSAAPVFASLRGGLHRLPARLARSLTERGVTILTGTVARELRRRPEGGFEVVTGPRPSPVAYQADQVVLALPAAPSARLLATLVPAAARLLGGVETASMAVVTFAFRGEELGEVPGSGFLVPPVDGRVAKAATFSANKWAWVRELGEGVAPGGGDLTFLRASVGRHREEAALQRDDDDLARICLDEVGQALGRAGRLPAPVEFQVQRWGGALPQYAVGHLDLVEGVRGALKAEPGLVSCGATYDGVGVPACIASARRAVAALDPAQ